jgi:hypothetical protein
MEGRAILISLENAQRKIGGCSGSIDQLKNHALCFLGSLFGGHLENRVTWKMIPRLCFSQGCSMKS